MTRVPFPARIAVIGQVTDHDSRPRAADTALRRRAAAVIPGGMYGHQSAGSLPPGYP